jgi:transcriptional regulator with XRE-family HTH domain
LLPNAIAHFGLFYNFKKTGGELMKFQRIQDLRVDSDLSQRQLGEILHISQRSYSHYETGSRGIPIEMLIRLADYYDTTIDYLVGRTDNKAPVK